SHCKNASCSAGFSPRSHRANHAEAASAMPESESSFNDDALLIHMAAAPAAGLKNSARTRGERDPDRTRTTRAAGKVFSSCLSWQSELRQEFRTSTHPQPRLGFDGVLRYAELPRNLLLREPVNFTQRDYLTATVRQGSDRISQQLEFLPTGHDFGNTRTV